MAVKETIQSSSFVIGVGFREPNLYVAIFTEKYYKAFSALLNSLLCRESSQHIFQGCSIKFQLFCQSGELNINTNDELIHVFVFFSICDSYNLQNTTTRFHETLEKNLTQALKVLQDSTKFCQKIVPRNSGENFWVLLYEKSFGKIHSMTNHLFKNFTAL